MVDIAVDFRKREGYLLQPQKSVVIPINTCKKSKMLEINDGYWKLDGKDMPIVTFNCSKILPVGNNISSP
jgi:hypothetical protein